MKKILLLIVWSVWGAVAQAQTVFAPAGAEWWYQTATLGGPYWHHVRVAGDTVLPGQPGRWKRLTQERYDYIFPTGPYRLGFSGLFCFAQTRGDEVWLCRDSVAWRILDFNAPLGHTDTVRLCPSAPHGLVTGTVRLDSLTTRRWGTSTIRHQWYSATSTHPYSDLYEYEGNVAERLGYRRAVMAPQLACGTSPDYPQLM
jgi:hypothetical protein